eukprot:gb/GECG01003512.1/.p1 GENE.gb/GECG01003512.1/~~gb/GECG01003512.1/.p1  ORF type:complete len:349 (+),score=64.10 gb/GECG01003512.1/:1-1047(+)
MTMNSSTKKDFMGTFGPLDEVTPGENVRCYQSSPQGSLFSESSPLSFGGYVEGNGFLKINDGIVSLKPFSLDDDGLFPCCSGSAPLLDEASPKDDQEDYDAPIQSHVLPDYDIPDGMPVYNYQRDEQDKLDSSSLLKIKIALAQDAMDGMKGISAKDGLHSVVRGKLLRFDGAQIPLYDKEEKKIKMLQVPDEIFSYDLDSGNDTLTVQIHRKYLPISKNFGDVPFRFAFYISLTGEVVCTNSFEILSKEPSQQEKLKAQQKKPPIRKRGPSPKEPRAGDAAREDNLVSDYIQSLQRKNQERVAHVGRKRPREGPSSDQGERKSVAGDSVTTEETTYEEETSSIFDYA